MKGNIRKKQKPNLFLAVLFTAIFGVPFTEAAMRERVGVGFLIPENISASVALATDYPFRGISQTDEDPAIQGSFDYKHPSGFHLGVWASNVDEVVSEGNIEIDFSGGYTRELFKNFNMALSVIYYFYPSGGDGPERDYVEGLLALKYAFSDNPLIPKVGVSYNYSPEFYGEDGAGHHILGTLQLTLPYEFGLSGRIGFQDVKGDATTGSGTGEDAGSGFDYLYWRIGFSKNLKGFDLDLSYWDTDETEFLGELADDRVVFTISRSF